MHAAFGPFLLCLLLALSFTTASAETLVYFGTYTQGDSQSEGIYVARLDEQTGAIGPVRLAAEAINPSFVTIHPSGKFLYAASEAWSGGNDAIGIIAYKIGDDGTLIKLNEAQTGGGGACHVSVDPSGRCIGVANYGGGSCALFPINDDGSLGKRGSFHQHAGSSVNPKRQKEPHAHSINFSADGSQAFVADLGIDQILVYDVDAASGTMKPASPPAMKTPAGGGPRHFCFAPTGDVACSNLELTSQVMLLRYDDQQNELTQIDLVSSLPQNTTVEGNSTAECLIHPNGRFAYVSNRGHNSIAIFEIDKTQGKLTPVDHVSSGGSTPRGFGISPDGKFIVASNQKTGEIISLSIDEDSGKLKPTGHATRLDSPVNVRFLQR